MTRTLILDLTRLDEVSLRHGKPKAAATHHPITLEMINDHAMTDRQANLKIGPTLAQSEARTHSIAQTAPPRQTDLKTYLPQQKSVDQLTPDGTTPNYISTNVAPRRHFTMTSPIGLSLAVEETGTMPRLEVTEEHAVARSGNFTNPVPG